MELLKLEVPPKAWRAGLAGLVDLWKRTGRPLVHVNGRRGNAIAIAAHLSARGFRHVTTVHGVLGLHSRRNAFYRLVDLAACRTARAVIAVNADTRRRIIRAGSPRGRTHVVANALAEVDLTALLAVADRRWTAGREGKPLRIGFLGRLSPEKGTRELLSLSRKLFDSGARATVAIAGDGPDRPWAVVESRDMTEAGFLAYRGVVQHAAEFLADVDVLVIPSRNEGLPYVLLEAMAAGCAVVAFDVGGIPEVVRDASLGLLVPAGDVDGLVAALRRLCDDPAAVESLGRAASGHVERHYALTRRLPLISRAYGIDIVPPPGPAGRSGEAGPA